MAKDNLHTLPSDFDTDEEKFSIEYGLQYGKYISMQELQSETFLGKRSLWIENREFAEGLQDTKRLKEALLGGDKAFSKLDFTPLPIIPKFLNAIKENIVLGLYKPKVQAIDPTSQKERDEERRKIQTNRYNGETRQQFSELLGMEIKPNGFTPDTDDEEELYMSTEYRQGQEIAMEQAIEVVLKANRYAAIRDMIVDDVLSTGRCVIKTDYDPVYGIKIQRIDSMKYKNSLDTSGLKDSRASFYHGHVNFVTYHELATIYGMEKASLMEHMVSSGILSNREIKTKDWDDIAHATTEVLYYEFKTTLNPKYRKKTSRSGNTFNLKEEPSTYTNDHDNVEVLKGQRTTWMEGAMLMGSDLLLYYRERAWQTTSAFKEKLPSYHVYDTQQMPIVRRMIPIAEKAHLALIKLDQMIAEAKPKGLAINESAMADIVAKEGDKPMGFLELIDMFNSKGSIVYRQDQFAGAGMPITELENGLPRDVMTFYNIYKARLEDLYFMSGLNPMAVGAAPEKRVSTESNKMALNGSLSAVAFIKNALVGEDMGVEYRLYEDVILRIGNIDKYDNKLFKQFVKTLGFNNMTELMNIDSFKKYAFLFDIQSAPDVQEKEDLAVDISIGIERNQITLADKIELESIKSPKLALMLLKTRIRRNAEDAHKKELEKIKAQQEAGEAERNGKIALEAQSMKLKGDMKIAEIDATHIARMREIAAQGDIDKAIAGAKEDNKMGTEFRQAQHKGSLQEEMENRKDMRQKDQQQHQDKTTIMKDASNA